MLWPDVTELKAFYDTPLGQRCKQSLRRAVLGLWPNAKEETLIGIGYALPCLKPFLKTADVVGAVMPAGQGVIHWPDHQDNRTILCHEAVLPFHSGTLNRMIVMHALEHSSPPSTLLNEIQRCLTPSGRVIFIVPNRHSLWARVEHSPYSGGQSYNSIQLKNLLQRHDFSVLNIKEAVFFLPNASPSILKFSRLTERFMAKFFPHFGGILLLEAEKRKEAPVRGKPIKLLTEAAKSAASLNRDEL